MDKETAIAAKDEEVILLGSHLQTAKKETAVVEGQLADALKEKEKAEARLGEVWVTASSLPVPSDLIVAAQLPWKRRS
jgi:hypothetical protein